MWVSEYWFMSLYAHSLQYRDIMSYSYRMTSKGMSHQRLSDGWCVYNSNNNCITAATTIAATTFWNMKYLSISNRGLPFGENKDKGSKKVVHKPAPHHEMLQHDNV